MDMGSSSSSPSRKKSHYHKERFETLIRRTRFFLWILGVSFIFLFSKLYSTNPFTVITKEGLNQKLTTNEHNKDGIEEKCDLFTGKWIREPKGSIYTNQTCPTLPESKNCGKYGKDRDYVNWRWKPKGCELPRFDSKLFLRIVRGKKMAFVGDSVARNQMESLLCLLSQEETPTNMYKDDEDRFRTWYFPTHDFTLMALWSQFLVVGTERVINGSASGVFDLHVDMIDSIWAEKLPGIHYAIISDGHWFFRKNYLYEGGNLIGCIFCSEKNITDLGVNFTIRRVFRTTLKFINKCEDCEGLLTLIRTFSPTHFEHGSWNGGGYCNRTQPLSEGEVSLSGSSFELRTTQVEEVERVRGEERRGMKWFRLLDVTKAMMTRADGHPGSHWNNEWMRGFNDCTHWCLPGPIDIWNDLLLAMLKDSLI